MSDIYWPSFFFLFFSGLACMFAVAVVISKNIVRMAFYLVLSLAATSGLFFLAGADFVGAMQLMIYVGGTLVLLIFGVMLTSQERFVEMRTSSGEVVVGLLLGGMLLGILIQVVWKVDDWKGIDRAAVEALPAPQTAAPLGLALIGNRIDKESKDDGKAGYFLPFEIVSVHLLVVLVGAAYLARAKRKTRAGID